MKNTQKTAPALSVYVASIPENLDIMPLGVPLRDEEIAAVGSFARKVQKYAVFRLLAYAMREALGVRLSDVRFTRTAAGKWEAEGFFFSLSHTKHAVAVALSRHPVGVDLESFAALPHVGVVERTLTSAERECFSACPDAARPRFLLDAWCKKEAIFKKRGEGAFCPEEIESADAGVRAEVVSLAGAEYLLALAADAPLESTSICFATL